MLKTTFGILNFFSGFAGTERDRCGGDGFGLRTDGDVEGDVDVSGDVGDAEFGDVDEVVG